MKLLTDVLLFSWPLLVFLSEIYFSIRVIYLIKNKIKIDIFTEIIDFLFIVYVIFLFYIVTISKYNYKVVNLNLFSEIFRYEVGSKLFIKNILGNLLLLIPYIFYILYRFKVNRLYLIILLTFSFSVTIEFIQLKVGRVFDVDDIMLNTVSSIIGYYLYRLCKIE